MREIKFRRWDALENKMWYDVDIENDTLRQMDGDNDQTYLQFTGLKDKNGTDIFEGDIVQRKGYKPEEIWFEDGGYLIGLKNSSDHHFYERISEQCEVIGNIYQNPELLK